MYLHATDHDPTSSKKQTLTVIQCNHNISLAMQKKGSPFELWASGPHTVKILPLVLTHHSNWHLHGLVLMPYKGGIMCSLMASYLPRRTQGALKCRHIHRQNQRLHCHRHSHSIFFGRISEHFSSTPCEMFIKRWPGLVWFELSRKIHENCTWENI